MVHKEGVNGLISAGIAASLEGDGRGGGGCNVAQDIGHIPAVTGSDGVLGGDGRKGKVLVAGFGAGIQVAAVFHDFPSVPAVIVGVAGGVVADAPSLAGGSCAAKHPDLEEL